jgi:hypothetical protein
MSISEHTRLPATDRRPSVSPETGANLNYGIVDKTKPNHVNTGSDLEVGSKSNSDREITTANVPESLRTTLPKKQQAIKAEANKNFSPITDASLRVNSYLNLMTDEECHAYLLQKYQNSEALLDSQCPSNIDDMHSWTIGLLKDVYTRFHGLEENGTRLTLNDDGRLTVELTLIDESTQIFYYDILKPLYNNGKPDTQENKIERANILFRQIMSNALTTAIHLRFPGSADTNTNLFLDTSQFMDLPAGSENKDPLLKQNSFNISDISFSYRMSPYEDTENSIIGTQCYGLMMFFDIFNGVIEWDKLKKHLSSLSDLFTDDDSANQKVNVFQLLISSAEDQKHEIHIEEPTGKERFLNQEVIK